MASARENLESAIESIRNSSNEFAFQFRIIRFPNALIGIAEGDSWFDYPPSWIEDPEKGDLINQLNTFKLGDERKFNILRIAEAGDTLENMVFGNDLDKLGEPRKNQFLRTLALVRRYKPKFVLFSGGGNDVVGDGLEAFINHNMLKGKYGLLRDSYVDYILEEVFREIFETFISEILDIDDNIQILLHGYGYAIPDGKPVVGDENFGFIGPWMAPTFARKRIDFEDGQKIIIKLIDKFNILLKTIAHNNKNNVHYLDLREVIQQDDWANELHLTVTGYEKVVKVYTDKLLEIFP
ncbi:GDSL-type esterase/lipase family protein [Acaryochloris marina]|uniref:SGNH hydrolase-type esterase domain-containing protein n=1 Tax=Acaryochloris marina (strain MBIC 11017) TaxID=329726 RepID=A8ZP57_ACAM1|nr:GDSL-type esterase/lipase family protein [Acaryochloris marina]ABW32793.1 hypothetical protein AM1_E0023 [Acaryochloris marina MBIC11017]